MSGGGIAGLAPARRRADRRSRSASSPGAGGQAIERRLAVACRTRARRRSWCSPPASRSAACCSSGPGRSSSCSGSRSMDRSGGSPRCCCRRSSTSGCPAPRRRQRGAVVGGDGHHPPAPAGDRRPRAGGGLGAARDRRHDPGRGHRHPAPAGPAREPPPAGRRPGRASSSTCWPGVVVAPISEEIMFRGFATTAWMGDMGKWRGRRSAARCSSRSSTC